MNLKRFLFFSLLAAFLLSSCMSDEERAERYRLKHTIGSAHGTYNVSHILFNNIYDWGKMSCYVDSIAVKEDAIIVTLNFTMAVSANFTTLLFRPHMTEPSYIQIEDNKGIVYNLKDMQNVSREYEVTKEKGQVSMSRWFSFPPLKAGVHTITLNSGYGDSVDFYVE